MDWPTATALIVLVAGVALVLFAALRVLEQALVRRATDHKKRNELITEASQWLKGEVNEMRRELKLPEK